MKYPHEYVGTEMSFHKLELDFTKLHQSMDSTPATPLNIRLDAAGSNSNKINICIIEAVSS